MVILGEYFGKMKGRGNRKNTGSKDSEKEQNSKSKIDVFFKKKQLKDDSKSNGELDDFAFDKSGGRPKSREKKEDFFPNSTLGKTSSGRKDEVDEIIS